MHSKYAPYIKNIQDYLKKKLKKTIQLKHKMAKQKRYEKARRKIKAHTRLQLKFLLHCRPHYLYTFTGIYKNKNQTIRSNPVKFRRETLITKVKYHGVQVADHVWVCSNLFALQTDYMNSGMHIAFDAYINKYTRHGKGAKKGTHDYGLYGSIGLRQATISASIHSQLKILPQTIKGINIKNK